MAKSNQLHVADLGWEATLPKELEGYAYTAERLSQIVRRRVVVTGGVHGTALTTLMAVE
jgi:hypothetical protein